MKKKEVVIIDYGIGNVKSIYNALLKVGSTPILTSDKTAIVNADKVILPGVGAFKSGMDNLIEKNLDETIYEYIRLGKPILGICLGMQMLLQESEEFGVSKGLGIIEGSVIRFPLENTDPNLGLKLPHVSWNNINNTQSLNWDNTIFDQLIEEVNVYFVHTFVANPTNKENILATTNYGGVEFCSAIKYNNIYGVQFHPEKSGKTGLQILKNFINLKN